LDQLVQIVGALLILIAFAAAQLGAMGQSSRPYLALNLVGAAVLAFVAWDERLWGFLVLEAVWAGVSLRGLVQLARGRPLSAGR
jgi:hypothetical protein